MIAPDVAPPKPQVRTATKRFPVIEVFGPTIQGEGPEAGRPCYFIRLGGCDYRCSWCDSMYAVEPAEVRAHAERLTRAQIVARVRALPGGARWVILSGGNPALFELGPLVSDLQDAGYGVAVETQGSRWKPWLGDVDRLVISPKPPSSGMDTTEHEAETERFMVRARGIRAVVKIVVFDAEDYDWACAFHRRHAGFPLYLSAGTPQDLATGTQFDLLTLRAAVAARYRWLCERVALDPDMAAAVVLPQLHVIAWGSERAR